MNKKFEEFYVVYQKSTQVTKDFIDSTQIGTFSEKLTEKTPKIKTKITVIIGNLFLKISTEEETLTEILELGIGAHTVMDYFNQIKKFIDENSANQTTDTLQKTNPSIQDDIAETEKELQSLNAIHTMASDEKSTTSQSHKNPSDETPAFPSMQADLLQKNNPANSDRPKWGSDN